MNRTIPIFLFFTIGITINTFGYQDFSIPNEVCINEKFTATNNNIGPYKYEWDFCEGDLNSNPNSTIVTQALDAVGLSGVAHAVSNSNHYVFITGRSNNSLVKVELGDNIDNLTPTVISLGDLGGVLNGPAAITIIKENGIWYGLIYNSGDDYIVRVTFGSDLGNDSPQAEEVFLANGGNNPRLGLSYGQSGTNHILVHSNPLSNTVSITNFGGTIANNPDILTNQLSSNAISGAGTLQGIDLINHCNNWYAFVVAATSKTVYRLDFGTNLYSVPTVTNITGALATSEILYDIKISSEGGNFYGFVLTKSGIIYRLNFGSNIELIPNYDDLGKLTSLSSANFFDFVKHYSQWRLFAGDFGTRYVLRGDFNNDCSAEVEFYTGSTPPVNKYLSSGTYFIGLKQIDENGNTCSLTKQIIVNTSEAPQLTSQITGNCLSSPISFEGQQVSGNINSWNWDFGDGLGTSTLQNDAYTYANAGSYQIKLNVTDVNGCSNLLIDTVQVYEEPVPDFTFPGGSLCMNNEVAFTNTSTGETGPAVTWTWDFNGEGSSSAMDTTFTFTTPGSKTIELKSSIPGCASVVQKTIFIEEAPTTDFSFDNVCNGQTTTFTDLTAGNNLTAWNWDFGDGNNSTSQSPTHVYTSPGQYDVTLTVSNSTGCSTVYTQTVYNHNIPTVDFTNDLACSSSPIQFTDQSLVQNANLAAWEWNFGDGNMSSDQNPQYLYGQTGDFTVQLKAYSEYGCVDSLETTVSVIQGPEVDFTWDKSCEGETTTFTDQTNTFGNAIDSWAWIMESTLKSDQNPTHTFNTSGIKPIQLSVTLANNCAQSFSQDIYIKTPPEVQFGYNEGCSDNTTTFYDLTDQTNDAIISREWRVDGQMQGTDSTYLTQLAPGTYSITLSAITNSGCEKTFTTDITLVGSPVAEFTTNTSYGAAPLTVSFINAATGGNTYEWSFGDADNTTSTEVNPEFTFNEIGIYTVTLKTFSEPDCYDEGSQLIEVVAPETSGIIKSITPLTNSDKTNFVVTIENTGSTTIDEGTNLIFRTDYGAEVVETLNQTIYAGRTVNNISSFALSSSSFANSLCLELFETDENLLLDRNCISLNEHITISNPYPNPSNGPINLDVILNKADNIQVRIINRSGQLQLSETFQGAIGLNQLKIAGETLSQGIYIVEVFANGITQRNKITIAK